MDRYVSCQHLDVNCCFLPPCAVDLDYSQHCQYHHLVRSILRNDQENLDPDQMNSNTTLKKHNSNDLLANALQKYHQHDVNKKWHGSIT